MAWKRLSNSAKYYFKNWHHSFILAKLVFQVMKELYKILFRSSYQRCSMKKRVLRNFAKFTGKRLCQSLFFNKVAGLQACNFIKKRLRHKCFSVNFAQFLRTPFVIEHLRWPLQKMNNFFFSIVKCHSKKWVISKTEVITNVLDQHFPRLTYLRAHVLYWLEVKNFNA